jgi:serine protease AprX
MRTRSTPATLVVLLLLATQSAALLSSELPAATSKVSDRLERAIDGLSSDAIIEVIVETNGPSVTAADEARLAGFEVVWTYDIIDALSAKVAVADLPRLAAQDWAAKVWDSRPMTTLMDVSASDIDAPKAWNAGFNGAGITVAVIDTGIETTDPAFAGAIVSCVATIGGLTLPECDDTDGHGTHVAGSVASRDATYRGIAWGAKLASIRVLHAAGAGTSADIVAGMNWVKNNRNLVNPPIRVATMSIGFLDPGCGDGRGPEAEAADALVAAGVSFTIAAGNAGHNSCTVDGASAAFNVVTVGAVNDQNTVDPADDTIADFSPGGPTKDGRLKPEISAPGENIWSVYLGPTIRELDGTSMATPHVAGSIAVLLQKEPSLTPSQVKSRITSNAFAPSAAGSVPNNDWGYGIVNVCKMLGLTGCAQGAQPVVVHVSSITMSFAHGNGKNGVNKHAVTTNVKIVDAGGAAISGATVNVNTRSPEGTNYALSGTTGSNGIATVSVTQTGGGHGSWQSCVTGVSGTYNAGANVETCDTLAVN